MATDKKLTKAQVEKLRMLRGELTKVRCWMTGFQAGRSSPGALNVGIPGDDSLRQIILFIDEVCHD